MPASCWASGRGVMAQSAKNHTLSSFSLCPSKTITKAPLTVLMPSFILTNCSAGRMVSAVVVFAPLTIACAMPLYTSIVPKYSGRDISSFASLSLIPFAFLSSKSVLAKSSKYSLVLISINSALLRSSDPPRAKISSFLPKSIIFAPSISSTLLAAFSTRSSSLSGSTTTRFNALARLSKSAENPISSPFGTNFAYIVAKKSIYRYKNEKASNFVV